MEKINLEVNQFEALISELEKRTGDSFSVWKDDFGSIFIQGEKSENEIMIKSNYFNTLVLARISFEKKRSGLGTFIISFLKDFGLEFGFEKIKIESTLSQGMNNLSLKMGFSPCEYEGYFLENNFFGNYELLLKKEV